MLLAFARGGLGRQVVSATLWPDLSVTRAAANLRTTLWSMRIAEEPLVDVVGGVLRMSARVSVDVDQAVRTASRVNNANEPLPGPADLRLLFADVLPDWTDEWVLVDQERHRQTRLHALERACDRLVELHRFGEAIDLGIAVVSAEPLRESAHWVLINAYLAEGNRVEAIRQYTLHESQLRRDLGISPSAAMRQLIAGVRSAM